jgi:2,3,4,5-tetrahydropyridine-2,6-dicarboxylate N-succinyltransferase
MNLENAKSIIENTFEQVSSGQFSGFNEDQTVAVQFAINVLDSGQQRVCSNDSGEWITHQWLKQAILLYFQLMKMENIEAGPFSYVDKIPLKKWTGSEGVRVVPDALVRKGAFVNKGAILMPSYVNIGAYVDEGTMIDTWATVGSCAQVGKNVHVSGGVGIGGVLEPVQANPVIIEDNAFIGSRCIVVEGAVVETGAVLGAGVTVTASTQIIDVTGTNEKIIKGRIPKYSIVIPGTRVKDFPAGKFGVPCALIIGERTVSTDKKTSLTKALREFDISV